jgi:secernin
VDLIISLVERHGQSPAPHEAASTTDHAFLLADGTEAFALEAAGNHWVYQEIHEVRAVSPVCVIRQDWDRISPGLAKAAIDRGWWPADGSKLDFAGTLSASPVGQASGLRRWGRATLLLEQQNGYLDVACMRRLLSDHYEGTHFEVDPQAEQRGPTPLCQHEASGFGLATTASWVVQLGDTEASLPLIWAAFGPPCSTLYFPVLVCGDIPELFCPGESATSTGNSWSWRDLHRRAGRLAAARESFDRLQAVFDADAEEFAAEGAFLRQRGETAELERLASAFMQRAVEQFENLVSELGLRQAGVSLHSAHARGNRPLAGGRHQQTSL